MNRNLILSLILAACLGYLARAYFEKPKVIEIPKDRVITRTIIDRKTGKPIEIITEKTKFDTDAALKLSEKRNVIGGAYGLVDKTEIYSVTYGRSLFPNIYVTGQVLFTKSSVEGGLVGFSWNF